MTDQLEAQQEEQRGTEERLIGRSDMERFMLRSPVEIAGVLRNLARTAQWVTVYFGDEDFYATTLVHVDRDKDMVVFERSPDDRINERLQKSREALFSTKHNDVTVQFVAREVKPARLKGDPVFLMPFPTELLRLQRREAFRAPVPTSADEPVFAILNERDETEYKLGVSDVSIGGIGLTDESCEIEVSPHTVYPRCRISLPEFGMIDVDLEIRNVVDVPRDDGTSVRRIGCAFVKLSQDTESTLQRYIHKLEAAARR